MKRKYQARLGLVLTGLCGFAFAGVNCAGNVDESSDEQGAGQAVTDAEESTTEAAQALPTAQCVTLKRGVLGGASDAQVATSGGKETKNYGAGLAMIAGQVAPGQRRSLVKFGMGAVPANLGVTSATLKLQARPDSQGGPGNQLSVHEVTSGWDEATVTWNTQPTFNAAVVASDQGGPGTHSFDVTGLAQAWNGGPNNGVLLEQNAFYYTNFTTSDDADQANRPALEVCYIPALCSNVTCTASNQCHVAGVCDPSSGLCSNPNAANGTACNDGNASTSNDVCTNGACAGTQASGGAVLVWSTGNTQARTQGVANWIAASGLFTSVTAVDGGTLSLATLTQYQRVLFFTSDSIGSSPVPNGNVLGDYALTGKRLVLGVFSWANQGGNTLGGKIITQQLSPFVLNGSSLYSLTSLGSYNAASPFFAGVTSLQGGYRDAVVTIPGATLVGSWNDGRPLLATKGNVVAVNLFPDDSYGNVSGNNRPLFINALIK